MHSKNRTRIAENFSDDARIGPNQVVEDYLEFQTEVEAFVENNAPLPVTFDVGSCQPKYFSEFTYSDFSGGFWIRSLNPEFNCEIYPLLQLDQVSPATEIPWKEKYHQEHKNLAAVQDRRVAFLAGPNLYHFISWELLERAVYFDDRVLIKTHPLTGDNDLRELANVFGWHRIIEPSDSGFNWFQRSKQVLVTLNSELFVRSLIEEKFEESLTKISDAPRAPYFHFYYLHKMMKENGHDEASIASEVRRWILAPNSGFVFPNQLDWKERLKNYFDTAMNLRKGCKPLIPFFNNDKNLYQKRESAPTLSN